jgi:hypothetical protein
MPGIKFWMWFNGIMGMWDLFQTGIGMQGDDPGMVILNGTAACLMFCCFFVNRTQLRRQREREAEASGQHRTEWFPLYDPDFHEYTSEVRLCPHVTLKFAEGWSLKNTDTKWVKCTYCKGRKKNERRDRRLAGS